MEFAKLEEVAIINARLLVQYGRHTIQDKANFRLVFADDQMETRFGSFDVYAGDIFLREEVGIHEVPKYHYMEPGSWVVERLIANHHKDVMGGDGYLYEPIYSFKISPIWRAVEFLIQSLFVKKKLEDAAPKTEKEAVYRDDQKKEKEKAYIRNLIATTPLDTSLHDGSAQSYSNNEGIDYRPSAQKEQ